MSKFFLLFIVLFAGCGDAVSTGHNTALDGVDLQTMTDDMAAQVAADPDVQKAIADHGKLKIVVQPVQNRMTAEVLPSGAATAFTGRVRVLLSRHSPNDYLWVMNRDAWYRLRGRELTEDQAGPSPEAINPEYALVATFSSITNERKKRRSSYYLCVYELTSLKDRTLLWTGKYEVKKSAVGGMLD